MLFHVGSRLTVHNFFYQLGKPKVEHFHFHWIFFAMMTWIA